MSYPKVMIHEGKHNNRHILIQNAAEVDPAYFAMFTAMDQSDCAYDGIEDCEKEFIMFTMARDLTLCMPARQAAAKWLLQHRGGVSYSSSGVECECECGGVEYERVSIVAIYTPDSLLEQYDV